MHEGFMILSARDSIYSSNLCFFLHEVVLEEKEKSLHQCDPGGHTMHPEATPVIPGSLGWGVAITWVLTDLYM